MTGRREGALPDRWHVKVVSLYTESATDRETALPSSKNERFVLEKQSHPSEEPPRLRNKSTGARETSIGDRE